MMDKKERIKEELKENKMSIQEKLMEIHQKLEVPKRQFNKFGNYKYRSCEDITESVKPLLGKATLKISDEMVMLGDRFYVKATATLKLGDEAEEGNGYAREAENRKGMDKSQITGAASSYARKYALDGLFLIDDNKDADSRDNRIEETTAISTTQIKILEDMIKTTKTNKDKILKALKVKELDEMTKSEYAEARRLLESKKKQSEKTQSKKK
jgi:hypothetical protein